jgi:hypothetical protein
MGRTSIAVALDSREVKEPLLPLADSPSGVDDAILTPGIRIPKVAK